MRVTKNGLTSRLLLWLFSLIGILIASDLSAEEKALVLIPSDVHADYLKFIGGRDPKQIDFYGGEFSRRDVIEVVLIQQALSKGGDQSEFDFSLVDSYARQLIEIKEGRAVFPLTSVWESDATRLSDHMYTTDLLIRPEEFVAGFYVKPNNARALQANRLSDLALLTAVSNPKWKRDWDLLESFIPTEQLYKSVLWSSMVKMVEFGRVDFLLAPFQSTLDLSLSYEDIHLVPIPGIKISLGEGRRVVFSKLHPKGQELYEAFQRGFAMMKKNGLIKRAYNQSGFFNERAKGWSMLSVND